MERVLENSAISRAIVGPFIGSLSPEEFEVLWGLTGEYTVRRIAELNGMTESQVNTHRSHLAAKAEAYLKS